LQHYGCGSGTSCPQESRVSGDQQGQKVYVDERERGQCAARERDLCFLFKIRGVAASFLKRSEGGRVTASLLERIGLGFSLCFPSFLKNYPLVNIFLPPSAYGWRFTYIENLYTCYLRKYCNNYCRDYLL